MARARERWKRAAISACGRLCWISWSRAGHIGRGDKIHAEFSACCVGARGWACCVWDGCAVAKWWDGCVGAGRACCEGDEEGVGEGFWGEGAEDDVAWEVVM